MEKLNPIRDIPGPRESSLHPPTRPTSYADTPSEAIASLSVSGQVELAYDDGIVVCSLESDGKVTVDGMRVFARRFDSPSELLPWLGGGAGDDVLTSQPFSLD